MSQHVFISYAHDDKGYALKISEALIKDGYQVWIDSYGLRIGDDWPGEITRAIQTCSAFIILLSISSVGSSAVRKELALAVDERKKILPIEIHPVDLPVEMRFHLSALQRIAFSGSFRSNYEQLLRSLDPPIHDNIPAVKKPSWIWSTSGILISFVIILASLSSLYILRSDDIPTPPPDSTNATQYPTNEIPAIIAELIDVNSNIELLARLQELRAEGHLVFGAKYDLISPDEAYIFVVDPETLEDALSPETRNNTNSAVRTSLLTGEQVAVSDVESVYSGLSLVYVVVIP